MATKKRKSSYKPKKGVSTTCRTAGSKLRKSKSARVKSKAGSKLASSSCGTSRKSTAKKKTTTRKTTAKKTTTRRKTTAKKSTTKKAPVIISFGSGSLARSAKRSIKKPGLVLSQVSAIANAKYGSDEKIRKIKAKVC